MGSKRGQEEGGVVYEEKTSSIRLVKLVGKLWSYLLPPIVLLLIVATRDNETITHSTKTSLTFTFLTAICKLNRY